MSQRIKPLAARFLVLAAAFLAAMGIFTLSYRLDNKYALQSVQPINGILFLNPDQGEPLYLINGWEYYRGRLLSPEDFLHDLPLPDDHIFIGQYPGMEAGNPYASPHGSASYRLVLSLPETPAFYTLELPEIYSSYRLYIGSRLMAVRGNPDPNRYEPALRSGSVTFEASGDVPLLFAVSDWSHLYSGMVYPPAFGTPDAVASLLGQRFAASLSVTVLAAILGFFQIALAFLLRNRRSLLAGLICAAFAVTTSSPAVHQLITTGIAPFYNIEIFCRYAVYALSLLLILDLCGEKNHLSAAFSYIAALFPFVALAVSLAAPGMTCRGLVLFSRAAGAYKIICAVWLLAAAFLAGLSKETAETETDRLILLAGICIFSSSLAADRLYPAFEPIRFFWFSEIAGFLFVLLLSFLLLCSSAGLYRQKAALTREKQFMEEQILMQKKHYGELASQIETIRAMRHDIRHHLTQLSALLKEGNAEAAVRYLDKITHSTLTSSPLSFCGAYYVDVLLRYCYSRSQELCIPMEIHADLPANPGIPEEDLCVILGNILENAVEASLPVPPGKRRISVSIACRSDAIGMEVTNPYVGELVPDGENFYSSKEPGRHGIGLSSIRSTAEKFQGEVWLKTEPHENEINLFTIQVLLLKNITPS